ncbi:MAG: bifunctional riboflavin kinase/FAD synthetase [Chloroflexota bacterium]
MITEQELSAASPIRDTYLSIGVFDGVHAGHRYLLRALRQKAGKAGLLSAVVTFTPHPQAVLHPESGVELLCSLQDRMTQVRRLGIDAIVVLTFTLELAALSAREFVTLLQKHLRMRGLLVGANFTLGKGREGDLATLQALGAELGFMVDTVPLFSPDGEVVSSSAVREALAAGDVKKAERFLGRPFTVSGRVFSLHGRGQQLGFPTANMEVQPGHALPRRGVYVTIASLNGQEFASVTNIGTRPTFEDGPTIVETHLLDYTGDLYGAELTVRFVHRLRDEEYFSSAGELTAQIARDVAATRALLSHQ